MRRPSTLIKLMVILFGALILAAHNTHAAKPAAEDAKVAESGSDVDPVNSPKDAAPPSGKTVNVIPPVRVATQKSDGTRIAGRATAFSISQARSSVPPLQKIEVLYPPFTPAE